jgi:hypothetical protein
VEPSGGFSERLLPKTLEEIERMIISTLVKVLCEKGTNARDTLNPSGSSNGQ